MINSKGISAIILAGGLSKRMGQDKAFINWNGKSFVQNVIDAVQPLVDDVIISGNQDGLNKLGYLVVSDEKKDLGPVSGMSSCFKKVTNKNVFVLSCDVPQINNSDLRRLLESHNDQYDITMYSYDQKTMPLVAIYSRRCFEIFNESLAKGQLRLFDVISELKTNIVPFTGEQGLLNINTIEDLKKIA